MEYDYSMKAKVKTTPVFRGIISVRTTHVALKNANRPKRLVNSIKNREASKQVKVFYLNKRSLENVEKRVVAAGKKTLIKGIVA